MLLDMYRSPLDKEMAFFETKRTELVAKNEGRFALIKDERLVGIYDTRDAALDVGYEQFGPSEPFLVHRIAAVDEVINFAHFAFP